MITVKAYELKNSANEMTLEQYEKISGIVDSKVKQPGQSDGFDYESDAEKWLDILEAAGLPKEVADELPLEDLIQAVKDFNAKTYEPYPFLKEIEVKGRTYRAFNGEAYTLPVKDGKLIEKYARQNPKKYVAEMLAVIYKDTELTDAEHFSNAHIKHKANIFRKELTGSVAVPYVMLIMKKILFAGAKELENAKEEAKEIPISGK